jgi:hypothetical protein
VVKELFEVNTAVEHLLPYSISSALDYSLFTSYLGVLRDFSFGDAKREGDQFIGNLLVERE